MKPGSCTRLAPSVFPDPPGPSGPFGLHNDGSIRTMKTPPVDLLAAYRLLSKADQVRFIRKLTREPLFRRVASAQCRTVRADKVDDRNHYIDWILAAKHLPTATLENWRQILAAVHAEVPELTRVGNRTITARALRKAWLDAR